MKVEGSNFSIIPSCKYYITNAESRDLLFDYPRLPAILHPQAAES
jgi:hypothetical protein